MKHEAAFEAVLLFFVFVGLTLGISTLLGRRTKGSAGYFAAHGQIPWFVNGVAFAGDYLSAASFLGICGMIAFYGYDGFLYSIGYLAGWIVALLVVAEPMKRLGRFTFADALDARFQSRGIKLAAGISTLAVSVFYLIPQMVGAGALVRPLLGFAHWQGVLLVGSIVTFIVVTAGMVSTTWVQFLKGTLLVIFSAILTWMILGRGFTTEDGGADGYAFQRLTEVSVDDNGLPVIPGHTLLDAAVVDSETKGAPQFIRSRSNDEDRVVTWSIEANEGGEMTLSECQTISTATDGSRVVNGWEENPDADLHPVGHVHSLPDGQTKTGGLGLFSFFSTLQKSEVVVWRKAVLRDGDERTDVYYSRITPGSQVLRPGETAMFSGIRGDRLSDKINFISLMLALFCGTASLPHILIRYYTVKDEQAARKSTIVGIASIGFFYVLTLYLGLGAMTSGSLDVTDSNMSAPLLARSMNTWLFGAISAIAFTTVLGTVSGLILASAGAVTHDLLAGTFGWELNDDEKVRVAKIASVLVGAAAIILGILFQGMNVNFLVGWAFSVAASANLPALILMLFWRRVTASGIVAGIVVGMLSSLAWILVSSDTMVKVYGLTADDALVPFSQPGIVTIPLGFATTVLVSLLSSPKAKAAAA